MPSWTKTPSQSAPTQSLMTSPSRKRRKSPVHARTCRPVGGRSLRPPVSGPLRLTRAATPSAPATSSSTTTCRSGNVLWCLGGQERAFGVLIADCFPGQAGERFAFIGGLGRRGQSRSREGHVLHIDRECVGHGVTFE